MLLLEVLNEVRGRPGTSQRGLQRDGPGTPRLLCWSEGASEPEALANLGIAIREYLSVRGEQLQDAEIREFNVA